MPPLSQLAPKAVPSTVTEASPHTALKGRVASGATLKKTSP